MLLAFCLLNDPVSLHVFRVFSTYLRAVFGLLWTYYRISEISVRSIY